MLHRVTILPHDCVLEVQAGTVLQACLPAQLAVDAPCGGKGRCGKCKVLVDGKEALACQTIVDRDMTVALPESRPMQILTEGIATVLTNRSENGPCLALDIGTTTVAGYLTDADGNELAAYSMANPQRIWGADIVSRIQHALSGKREEMRCAITQCAEEITRLLCQRTGISPDNISVVSLVGNPAMQQLFLGIDPKNLAQIPYAPVLTCPQTVAAEGFLPICKSAQLRILPNIGGFVGGDTVACVAATQMSQQEDLTLLIDIGTNGEMVLGNKHRMVACSTAAGPALEGAGIQFGMSAAPGAIDHVTFGNGTPCCHVIGSQAAEGICGSGLMDAIAWALHTGQIDERGRIRTPDHRIMLTDSVYLTQDDIRQVQLAKGAIAAGIELLAGELDVSLQDIQRVYLAGAFGTYMDPASACRIGLIPAILENKITAIGNAAGSGAKLFACDEEAFQNTKQLVSQIEHIELAALPAFQRCFARNMRFPDPIAYWMAHALSLGFSVAAPLKTDTLLPRADVRAMCAADKCGAYGKNWTCPPHCGTLEQCILQLQSYEHGILLQTVGTLEKTIDTKGYRQAEEQHLSLFHRLSDDLKSIHPRALCLGSGGCRICGQCAYPEPCRFPDKACASMEGYGLFVTQVCRDNGLAYYHGERTVTYTACVLF